MARKESSLIGIDLNESEIRVVEVRYKAGKPFVHRAGVAPMPNGCFFRGHVQNTGTLAVALRRLIDSIGSSATTRVVFGLNTESVVMRSLTVPKVPGSELASVVATEVDHFGIVQSKGGAHGFIPLSVPGVAADERSSQVVVLGVEEVITHALRELADRSGLEIVALEPAQLAMLRTAALGFPSSATAFVLLVGTMSTDIAFLVNGSLIALRRIDIGSYSLIDSLIPTVAIMPGQSVFDEPMGPQDSPEGKPVETRNLNTDALRRLELETRRTIDYLQREFPDFAVIDRVHVAANSVELAPLGKIMSERFGMPADLVLPPNSGNDASQATLEMGGDGGLRFTIAYGLAMTDTPVPSARVPQIDLFSTQRTVAKNEETKRNFAGAIVVSVLSILVGLIGSFLYNAQTSRLEGQTSKTVFQTAQIRTATDFTVAQRLKRAEQFRVLRKEGIPIVPIMDYISASVQPGLGLRSITITPDLHVNVTGESIDESAIIQQSQLLQHSPILQNVMINSFSRDVRALNPVIGFTLTASTISADRIKLPEALVNAPGIHARKATGSTTVAKIDETVHLPAPPVAKVTSMPSQSHSVGMKVRSKAVRPTAKLISKAAVPVRVASVSFRDIRKSVRAFDLALKLISGIDVIPNVHQSFRDSRRHSPHRYVKHSRRPRQKLSGNGDYHLRVVQKSPASHLSGPKSQVALRGRIAKSEAKAKVSSAQNSLTTRRLRNQDGLGEPVADFSVDRSGWLSEISRGASK